MSETARAKYQSSGSPAEFSPDLPRNARKEYNSAEARPSGRSGGVRADTPHRVSSSIRKSKPRSRRRG
jgi:hypothetical protein